MSVSLPLPLERRREMQMPPGALKVLGVLVGVFTKLPAGTQEAFRVLLFLIVLDLFTGTHLAFRQKKFHSSQARGMLWPKLKQYAGIIGLGWAASVIAHVDFALTGAVIVTAGIEFGSVLENVIRLERCGGVPLGPARPYIQRLASYFAVANLPGSVPEVAVTHAPHVAPVPSADHREQTREKEAV